MKTLAATLLSATLITSTAYAGGPVVVEEETQVVAERPATSIGIWPILLVIGLCVALCGGDDDELPTPQ